MSHSFALSYISPFRLDYTVWVLRRRAKNHIDNWNGTHYLRAFVLEDQLITVAIEQDHDRNELIVTYDKTLSEHAKKALAELITKTFGLNIDLSPFYKMAKKDKHTYLFQVN